MSETAGANAGATVADPAMRRLLHTVEHLRAEADRGARANTELRESLDARLAQLELDARSQADAFVTTPLGKETQDEIESATGSLAHRGTAPTPPGDLAAARRDWALVSDELARSKREVIEELRRWQGKKLKTARSQPAVPGRLWEMAQQLDEIHRVAPSLRDEFVAREVAKNAHLKPELSRELARRAAALAEVFADGRAVLADIVSGLDLPGASWADPRWHSATPAGLLHRTIRIGEFRPSLPSGAGEMTIPALVGFPLKQGIALRAGVDGRDAAVALARSIMLRLLAAIPPGRARFVVVDPVSLGRTVADFRHLAEFDERLVDTKTWTSERDIERRLEELADHLEVVISKYLRGQFESIDDYNVHAGEVAEPYRILVVFDYPHGFSERSARQLLSLVENGPRCGVHTILLCDPEAEAPSPLDRLTHSMQGVNWLGRPVATLPDPVGTVRMDFVPDAAPTAEFAVDGEPVSATARLLAAIGESARTTQSGPVTLERILPIVNRMIVKGRAPNAPRVAEGALPFSADDPSTWWSATTAASATALLGRSGAQDVASMLFSSTEVAGGAMMVGLPRSGKSTALHAAITSMALFYSPDELELYLVDSKHGVEFQAYDRLPHARLVSVHSEREFAVAVMKSLVREIERRAQLMKERGRGIANITDYRAATGEVLARIVLVMDEFHEVFEDNDALGQAAFGAFSDIVRQGPFAGVHIVLSSQTLSGMPSMDRQTLDLLPMRVAFMCNELDADYVMGESQREAQALTVQGEGLINPLRGSAGHSKRFKGVYIASDHRTKLLHDIATKASGSGFHRTPRVFDGGSLAERPLTLPTGEPTRPRIAIGEPFDLQDYAAITLRRRRGTNILLVGGSDDDDAATDVALHAAVHSCLGAVRANGLSAEVVDLLDEGAMEPEALELGEICAAVGARYARGGELAGALARAAATTRERRDEGRFDDPACLLVVNGLQRAFDLAPHDAHGLSSYYDDDGGSSETLPGEDLHTVATSGPDVGVHVVAVVDSLAQFDRRAGRELLSEFELRIAGQSARPSDVGELADTHTDRRLMRHQIALIDRSRSGDRRLRGYPLERRAPTTAERTTDGL